MKPYTLPSSELPRLKTAAGLKRLTFAMRLWHYCRRTRTTVARAHGRAFACWPLNRTASHGNTYAASLAAAAQNLKRLVRFLSQSTTVEAAS
jgi:hypothetical protein